MPRPRVCPLTAPSVQERFKASIGLKFARVQEAPADPQHPFLFHLVTPYVTYYLRAKHGAPRPVLGRA